VNYLRKSGNSGFTQPSKFKPIHFYNLDVIISVGYRVKSKRGTHFRQWALSVLKDHLINGHTQNLKRLEEKRLIVEVKRTEEATNLVSTYLGKTKDTETLIIKPHLLCERFLYQYIEKYVENSNQLYKARLSFRQLLRLTRSFYQENEKQWLWECLDKLNGIRNTYAHKLETEYLVFKFNRRVYHIRHYERN